jgi:hypothetical protein
MMEPWVIFKWAFRVALDTIINDQRIVPQINTFLRSYNFTASQNTLVKVCKYFKIFTLLNILKKKYYNKIL